MIKELNAGKWLILFLFFPLITVAQDPYFKKVPIQESAAINRINAICQDSRKIIWIGTTDGLYRFNGVTFEHFLLPDEHQQIEITALSKTYGNGILAGSKDGKIILIENDRPLLIKPDTFQLTTAISAIRMDQKGAVWFSTYGQGLFRYADGEVNNFGIENGIGDNYIYDLVLDSDNQLWIGSDGGLSFVNTNQTEFSFKNLDTKNGLPDNIVRTLSQGPGNFIGIGMEEGGFCMYNPGQSRFMINDFFRDWKDGPITSLTLLSEEFWIGNPKSGIVDFEFSGKRRIRRFDQSNGAPVKDITCMMKDHEGNIWIGAGSDLFFSPGEKIEFKKSVADVPLENIRTILTDQNGNFWFSNESGVFCYVIEQGLYEHLDQPLKGTGFEKLNIISLFEDIYGYIWMGTFDAGVIRYHPKTKQIKQFDEQSGLINMNVLSIDGTASEVWFATLGGVSKCTLTDSTLHGVKNFVSFSEENGLGNNFIYSVFIDSKERIWFGTDGKGITCYHNGSFINYNEEKGLKSKIIYSVTEDHAGNIWLSSLNEGIYKFDGKEFTNYSLRNGLSDLNISALATDINGNLIIVNKRGFDVMDPENNQILSYGPEAGLTDIDPNLNVIDVDKNGDVFAGIRQGILKISLEKKASAKFPIIVLDKVMCFLEQIDTTLGNSFKYNENHISFSFFSVWYIDPLKVSYQYKLDGYNNDWITTSDRLVTFPNLQPGNYTFYIRTSLNGNFELSGITTYSFTIKQPFWQQAWFIIVSVIIIVGLFYFYLRFRDKRIQALESLNRERIESQFEVLRNQVNPHFLFNSFNTLISIIEEDKDVAVEYVNKLSDYFRSILTYRDKDLISLSEELELAEAYIFLQKKRYGNNFKVKLNISEELIHSLNIPPLALQILLENCLKHNAVSKETPLLCEIYNENNAYLVVKNNINKRMSKEPSTGIGIQNLKNRFKIITGADIIISEQDGTFIVKLPIIKIT